MKNLSLGHQIQRVAEHFGGLSPKTESRVRDLLMQGMSVEDAIAAIENEMNIERDSSQTDGSTGAAPTT